MKKLFLCKYRDPRGEHELRFHAKNIMNAMVQLYKSEDFDLNRREIFWVRVKESGRYSEEGS